MELDGYVYKNNQLLQLETDAIDVEEAQGVLINLFKELHLGNESTTLHHLELSQEHYIAQRWDDSISNSRKFLECILREVAVSYSLRIDGFQLELNFLERQKNVREYLEEKGILERKEKDALAKIYSLLSHTGGHPYMARNDQARLLRHLALTFTQFVMLRFKGKLESTQ